MKAKYLLLIACLVLTVIGCKGPDSGPSPIAVEGVILDTTAMTLITGGSATVTAAVLPDEADNKTISWSVTGDTAAITTVIDGASITVTAVAIGEATLTATSEDEDLPASCTVSVVPTHTISFAANGGTGAMDQIITGEGFSETLPASTMTPPANYAFAGWVTDPLADALEYIDGTEITIGTEDIILYAYWGSFYSYAVANDEATITGLSQYWDGSSDLDIPSSIHGKSVVSIAAQSFVWDDGITAVNIPDSITSLAAQAFFDCDSLTSITMGTGVASLSYDTFYSCGGIETITIAAGNPNYDSIDDVIFNEAHTSLIQSAIAKTGNYTVPDGVTRIEQSAFEASQLTTVNLPASGLTYLGNYAFRNSSLESIVIPEGITYIGTWMFIGSKLKTVSLPSTVYSIRNDAFIHCFDLQSYTVASANATFSSSDGVVYNKAGDKLALYPVAKDVSGFSFPAAVTAIGDSAFYRCRQETAFSIPEGVTALEEKAFYDTSFTSLTLPSTITSIGYYALAYSTEMTSLTIKASTPPSVSATYSPFFSIPAGLVIYVPEASVDAYKAAEGWSSYADRIEAINN